VGRALLVLVVIGALAGTTAWGFVNRSSAERWRDRSEAADADLREALDRVDATSSELEDARTRLRDLANENAGETDRNRILSDIVAQAPEVTAALADCQQQTTDLANDIIAAFGDPAPDTAGLQQRTDEVNEVCADALDQAQELEAAIEALGI
jgi:succinate dehydrogenase/fumarate reductase flavoprotein subunit